MREFKWGEGVSARWGEHKRSGRSETGAGLFNSLQARRAEDFKSKLSLKSCRHLLTENMSRIFPPQDKV
jgi:hypothetical protein